MALWNAKWTTRQTNPPPYGGWYGTFFVESDTYEQALQIAQEKYPDDRVEINGQACWATISRYGSESDEHHVLITAHSVGHIHTYTGRLPNGQYLSSGGYYDPMKWRVVYD